MIRFCLVGTVEAGDICTTRMETATIIAANAVRKSTGVKRKMTELERCALLGDRKAQEECTRQGILLPCPLCKKAVYVYGIEAHKEKMGRYVADVDEAHFIECDCGYAISGESRTDVIARHNTRPEPPIGRCLDCENTCPGSDGSYLVCCIHGHAVENDDWCNDFEKKEG